MEHRIQKHPILSTPSAQEIDIYWNAQPLKAHLGETIAAALMANGIMIFGHHPKDGAPQSIYCANGQCSQCMVIADGIPLKACMEMVQPGMRIVPADSLPTLPKIFHLEDPADIQNIETDVLIIGGGPAGLSAAIELGKLNIPVLLVDDKLKLGGKLILQTHRFFGSVDMVHAGMRGIEIASLLEAEVKDLPSVQIWRNSVALAVFSDRKVGILQDGSEYVLISPKILLTASGAREKFLAFKGNTLPGVLGAGAFQTLVNRDLVKIAERLFIVGGGNVGLIAGYHALQAGIQVTGLIEALPQCGGYQVHKDKLERFGVPIHTSHTILSANGRDRVESVTIVAVDESFNPILGTERVIPCDCVLVAVGLDPVNEFQMKAKEFGIPSYSAGDAEEIAEASAAIMIGKIRGREIARSLGLENVNIPENWLRNAEILKSKPGKIIEEINSGVESGVIPVIHCSQEIPCDPCSRLCNEELIRIASNDIRDIPRFIGKEGACKGCLKCLIGCPGLAITIVDYRKNREQPVVSIPLEFGRGQFKPGDLVQTVDTHGTLLGEFPVKALLGSKATNGTWVLQLISPREKARSIAGVVLQAESSFLEFDGFSRTITDDNIVCRCERVTAGEIRRLILEGYRDVNEIKSVTRAGMGACGGKTCLSLIRRIFAEEHIPFTQISNSTPRPLFVEVPISTFAGYKNE